MNRQARYLILSDFDGTLLDTFSPSPNGIDVKKAYALALGDLFGDKAREWFISQPGLSMSTPTEIVSQVLGAFRDLGGGISLSELTKLLVDQKLDHLLPEIGQKDVEGNVWPQPLPGVLNFAKTLSELKREGIPLDFGIVSSGHIEFELRSLDIWGIPHPDILITDDDLKDKPYPVETERRFKPGVFPFALAHQKWLRDHIGLTNGESLVAQARESRSRVIYIGDSLVKDGGMAKAAGVQFCLVTDTPWTMIANELQSKRRLFDGRPISEIIGNGTAFLETMHQAGKERL